MIINQLVGINAASPEQAKMLASKMSAASHATAPEDLDRLLSAVQRNPGLVKKALKFI